MPGSHAVRNQRLLTAVCVLLSAHFAIAYINLTLNSGNQEMTQYKLGENLHQLHNPLFWLSASTVFGFAYMAIMLFWRFIPLRVRVIAVAIFSLWLVLMTVTGVLREVRIFSELSGLILLALGLGVHGWLEEKRHAPALV